MTVDTSTPATIPDTPGSEQTRRDFLYVATATVASIGTVAAAWPLIDQMNPDAATVAGGGPIDVDLSHLQPGQQIVARWRDRPVFIVRRTDKLLQSLQDPNLVAQLADPQSQELQQPPYATN